MAGTIDIKPATKLRLALDVPAGKQPVFNMISTRWHFQRFDMVLLIYTNLSWRSMYRNSTFGNPFANADFISISDAWN